MSEPIAARFVDRHIGPRPAEISKMLAQVGSAGLDDLISETVPAGIRITRPLDLPDALSEPEAIERLRTFADKNTVLTSLIGQGYFGTITPPVIQRNILENPAWYTAYTPYQAEISQGRLEALLNFQTMVSDLTGLEIANASLLDEGTAAAEAMAMTNRIHRGKRPTFFVDERTHPQTITVMATRAEPIGIELIVGPIDQMEAGEVSGCLIQYPDTTGAIPDLRDVCARATEAGALVVVATDLLALTMLESPGELGASIAVGSAQRFGVPMGFGGPHAAFIATTEDHVRALPGRVVGGSTDPTGE